jgi:NodT family efflux transporter outer membrane factor (OMF) lipoprotein
MLRSLLCFLCMACLASCVNYAGIHQTATPMDDAMLSTSYTDTTHPKIITVRSTAWWTIYQDPQLNKLIQTALVDSPTVQIAQSRLQEAQHIAEAVSSSLWPSLSTSDSLRRERLTENTFFPPPFGGNNYTESYVGLNFNYEFDFWGKNRAAVASRVSLAHAREADVLAARLILASAITSNYFQLQYNMAALKINRDLLHQRQQMLAIISDRAKNGIESDIPVTTAVAAERSARMIVDTDEQQIKISIHQLAALSGANPFTTDIEAKPFFYNRRILKLPRVIPANLLARRPDIIAARFRAESAASEIKVAKARFYPNVNLIGLLSLQSFILAKTFDSSSRDSYAGAALDLPLFEAGQRRANLKTRYAEYNLAVEEYNQTILTGLREVADQITTLHSLQAQEADQARSLQAIQKNYALTRARYHHGIVDYMKVLESEDTLLSEKNREIQLQAQHLTQSVALIKALGGTYLIEG